MNKRGPIITVIGMFVIGISLSIATSVIPSDVVDPDDLSVSLLFEEMFDEISNETQIIPGDSTYFYYDVSSSDVSLLWGIQLIDYQTGDELIINISNIFGDDYGEFVQNEQILFEVLDVPQSDTLNFEIQNTGTRNVSVIMMFSQNLEDTDTFSNPNSPVTNMVLPLVISGFLLILGIIISIIGIIVALVDWKNNQNNKRNY